MQKKIHAGVSHIRCIEKPSRQIHLFIYEAMTDAFFNLIKRKCEMYNNNLSSHELQAAYKKEQQYILELKENWLRALDRGDLYDLSEMYEDEFGFNNVESLNSWQFHTMGILREKSDHVASITYLKLRGDSTAFNSVIFSHATMNERHYTIRRSNDSATVVMRSTEDEFFLKVELPNLDHEVVLDFDAERILARTGVTPPLEIHYSFKSSGVALAISDGLAALQVDKEIHDELINLVFDFGEGRQLTPDAFKPLSHKRGYLP
jgi:hypothetical protein